MNHSGLDPAAMGMLAGVGMIVALIIAVVALAIAAFICWLMFQNYERVPIKFRTMEPWKVWLNLIPCVGLVWNFWVFPGLAKSNKAYFDSVGDTTVGDCGENLGKWYSICCACSIIPYIGIIPGIGALVLLIMFLVKANELKAKIPATAA